MLKQLAEQVDKLSAEVADLRRRILFIEGGGPPPLPAQRSPTPIRFGLTAVNRIGAVTLAIGIIFFFKYAVDSQWIGPGIRILLGMVAGCLLITAAEWFRQRGQALFSQGIAGCGLATLYITSYAAFAWYHWFSSLVAAVALLVVSALAVVLSVRYAHAAIAALGFAGAVLTPVLLRADDSAAIVTLAYLLLIDITCIAIASRYDWPVLAPLVAAEIAFAGAIVTPALHPDWFVVFALALATERFIAAALFTKDKLRGPIYVTAHCLLILALLREVVLWTERTMAASVRNAAASEFGSLLLAVYGIAALSVGIARRSHLTRSSGLALIGLVIAKLYLWDVWFLQHVYRMSAFGMLGIRLLMASWIYSRAKDTD